MKYLKGSQGDQPPDLDEISMQFKSKLKQNKSGGSSSGGGSDSNFSISSFILVLFGFMVLYIGCLVFFRFSQLRDR